MQKGIQFFCKNVCNIVAIQIVATKFKEYSVVTQVQEYIVASKLQEVIVAPKLQEDIVAAKFQDTVGLLHQIAVNCLYIML